MSAFDAVTHANAVAGAEDGEGFGDEAAVDETFGTVIQTGGVEAEGAADISAGEVADDPTAITGSGNAGGASEAVNEILDEGDAVGFGTVGGAMGTVNIVVGTVDVVDVIGHQSLGLFQGETAAGDTADTDISAADGGIDGEGTIVRAD